VVWCGGGDGVLVLDTDTFCMLEKLLAKFPPKFG